MKNKLKILFLFLILTPVLQAQVSEYEHKAAFIERFTRFIEWPTEIESNHADSTFVIAVLGENPFKNSLDELFSVINIKGQAVKLVYTNNIREIVGVNVVFIAESERKSLDEILNVISSKPILIISDSKGFAEHGTHINMYLDKKYIRYEINEEAINKSGLRVSSLLLSSAKIVTTDE